MPITPLCQSDEKTTEVAFSSSLFASICAKASCVISCSTSLREVLNVSISPAI